MFVAAFFVYFQYSNELEPKTSMLINGFLQLRFQFQCDTLVGITSKQFLFHQPLQFLL